MKEIVVIVVGLCVAIFLLLFGIAWLNNTLSLGAEMAEVEQVRHAAAVVDPQQAEDVVGQAVDWNRTIASNRAWNKAPIIGLAIPDEWDRVEYIEIPTPHA